MEEILIEKVRLHNLLYNTQSCNYRDQNMRQQAWQEIAEELKTTAVDVKTSWDRLRRCFLNALSRRRSKKRGDSGKKTPWKYEAQMSFLLPFLDTRNTESNITDFGNYVDDSETKQELNNPQEEAGNAQLINEGAAINTERDIMPNSDAENPLKKINRASSQYSLLEKVKTLQEDLQKRKYGEKEKRSNEIVADMDETDMFFMSMSKMTKTLPFIEQAKIKKLLSNAVLDAQIAMSKNSKS